MNKQTLTEYILQQYGISPDYPFGNDFESAIFRHKDNKKWFALFMKISKDKLGPFGSEMVEVVNVKCDPMLRSGLLTTRGVYTAYHMNKIHWITLCLKEITEENLKTLLDFSYDLTKNKKKTK